MKESNLTGKWKVSDLKKNTNWLFHENNFTKLMFIVEITLYKLIVFVL